MHGHALFNRGALILVTCRKIKTQEYFPSHAVKMLKSLLTHIMEFMHSVFIDMVQGWLKSNPLTIFRCKLIGRVLTLSIRHWPFVDSEDRNGKLNGWSLPFPVNLLSHFFQSPCARVPTSKSHCFYRDQSIWWDSLKVIW